jgi:hypothetical protein
MDHFQSEVREQAQLEKNSHGLIKAFTECPRPLNAADAASLVTRITKAITTARSVLKWSFPHAYFMKQDANELRGFESKQAPLTHQLEVVSGLVERAPSSPIEVLLRETSLLEEQIDALTPHVD